MLDTIELHRLIHQENYVPQKDPLLTVCFFSVHCLLIWLRTECLGTRGYLIRKLQSSTGTSSCSLSHTEPQGPRSIMSSVLCTERGAVRGKSESRVSVFSWCSVWGHVMPCGLLKMVEVPVLAPSTLSIGIVHGSEEKHMVIGMSWALPGGQGPCWPLFWLCVMNSNVYCVSVNQKCPRWYKNRVQCYLLTLWRSGDLLSCALQWDWQTLPAAIAAQDSCGGELKIPPCWEDMELFSLQWTHIHCSV